MTFEVKSGQVEKYLPTASVESNRKEICVNVLL